MKNKDFDDIFDNIGYVKSSTHRKKVFLSINNTTKIPSEIVKDTEMKMDDVSRALRALNKKNLVTCLTPERKKGRVYQLSKKGKKILKEIES